MRERKRKTEIREVNWLTNERERERDREAGLQAKDRDLSDF